MDEKDLTQIEEILKQQLDNFSKKIHRQLDILIETIGVLSEKLDRIIAGYRIAKAENNNYPFT